jgi:hypothetical protein
LETKKSKSILIALVSIATLMMITSGSTRIVFADALHCDQAGWPSCYSVGYGDGQVNQGAPCPSGHSSNFGVGWYAASNRGSSSNTDWSQGNADGKVQADSDFQAGTGLNLHCGFEHSINYCLGFRTGYLAQWGIDVLAHGGK